MKEVVKNANNQNQIKVRKIPIDIIEKYHKKLQSLEENVEQILEEERNEREIAKIENQRNKAEKILKGAEENKSRSWFQSKAERKIEKGNYTNLSINKNVLHHIYLYRETIINGEKK